MGILIICHRGSVDAGDVSALAVLFIQQAVMSEVPRIAMLGDLQGMYL